MNKLYELIKEKSNHSITAEYYETVSLVKMTLCKTYRICLENNQSSKVQFWDFSSLEEANNKFNSIKLRN
jgi:hypothetical protein